MAVPTTPGAPASPAPPAEPPPADAPPTGNRTEEARVPAVVRLVILVVLAVGFLAVGLHQAGRDALTVDEGIDVSSGVSFLVRRDVRMNPEHPPLPKAVAALPALMAHPIVPDTKAWREGDWFDWSDDFVRANEDAGRLHDIVLYARAVVLLEVLVCAGLLYLLAARLFGPDGALLATVCWLTTPFVVGIGHFAMVDVPFALAVLAVLLLLARWVESPTVGRTIALGAGLGLSLATRHTAIVLVVIAVVVMAHARRKDPKEAVRSVGIVAVISVLGLWLVYRGLAPGGSSDSVQASFEGLIGQAGDGSVAARLVGALPLPLEWRAGFAYLDLTSTARPSSLLGQSWDGGAWWYFPVSAVLKLPLTLTVAIVGGWIAAARRGHGRLDLVRYVAGPALLLWLFLVAQPLNLGLRLALPTLALAFVGLAALPELMAGGRGSPVGRAVVGGGLAIVLAVQVLASGAALPHSLAWTPVPFTPAYRWVSDSNLDAGQGLHELQAWARRHPGAYEAFDRTRGLEVGEGTRPLKGVDPADVRGWVAVGVTPLMQTRRDDLAWLRAYCPVATIAGGSIVVYRFGSAPDPRPGPERPVGPCIGAARSSRTG